MIRTTLFQSNRSQAVRLPKDVAFPEGVREVSILRDGSRRVIVPTNAVWDDFFDAPGIDISEREQPEAELRETFQMLRYMLDTNLCIRVLRDRPTGLRTRFNAEADALCTSTVVRAELLHGAGKSAKPVENRRKVERFAGRLDVLAFDAEAAAHSAEIRTTLERQGQPIGAMTCWVKYPGRIEDRAAEISVAGGIYKSAWL